MRIDDLGLLPYRDAWAVQERAHEEVLAGGEERIFLVEHPPVITYGRRPGVDRNLVASPESLAALGVEIVQSDRGGDITFHGPGQLVAYPILRLADHGFSVGKYVHTLEAAAITTLADVGIPATADPSAVGVWVNRAGTPAKICAIGVRIRRGVSLHGLALNVNTDLSYFNLIIPCGLPGRAVTSLQQLLGERAPDFTRVKQLVADRLLGMLAK
ncbi:MAG TPA: lipoyl(octanoyl) transferase LipB [Tepidisphaeraceae bacterium]|jgi:lipoate-protein ligase B|nr:lipoyl(octanoyl) transferase LipB [Tepidisphaeraceae bacterium]